MLPRLADYIFRKKDEWKSDFFKEPQQKWYFLPFLVFSVAAICWGVYEYPADPNVRNVALAAVGVCGGISGLLTSVSELLPKSQTQLAGILRMWAVLIAFCAVPATALQFLPPGWL